jgi:hypothetical protein
LGPSAGDEVEPARQRPTSIQIVIAQAGSRGPRGAVKVNSEYCRRLASMEMEW